MAGKRGPNYPAFGLGEAINRARKLYEQDGTARTAPEVAVRAWGYTTLNGSSLRALAGVRQYGLLESSEDSVKLSDRALAILLSPVGSSDRVQAINEAAHAPAIFATLNELYTDGLPSDAAIVSTLVRKYGFQEEPAQKCVSAYRETIELVKQSGVADIPPTGAEQPARSEKRDERPATGRDTQGGRMEFHWPLSGDAQATLTVSRRLDADDIETLVSYFEIAKKALRKSAASQAAQAAAPSSQPEA